MNQLDPHSRLVAQRVQDARKRRGLTHEEMGEKLGLTKAGYGHYERGRQAFSIEQLFVIARVLDRPVEWLLGLNSEMSDDELLALALYRRAVRVGLGEAALRVLGAVAGDED